MKRIWIPAISALMLVGCAAQDSGEETAAADVSTEAAAETKAAEVLADTSVDVDAVTANVTLTGTLGCGHCTFKVGESCATAMITEDEVVHILEGTDDALFEDRKSGKAITVVGALRVEEGTNYVNVESWES